MKYTSSYYRQFILGLGRPESEFENDPVRFLGPNWETVLNWWEYYDSKSESYKRELRRKFERLPYRERMDGIAAFCNARDSLSIGCEFFHHTNYLDNMPYPTCLTKEIIFMDKILEMGYRLTFIPLAFD